MSKIIKASAAIKAAGAAVARVIGTSTASLHDRVVTAHIQAETVKIVALTKAGADTEARYDANHTRLNDELAAATQRAIDAHKAGHEQNHKDRDASRAAIHKELTAAMSKRTALRQLL